MLQELSKLTTSPSKRSICLLLVVSSWLLGLIYLVDPQDRSDYAPQLLFPEHLLSMYWWGGLFILNALTLTVSLAYKNRRLFTYFLFVYGATLFVWSLMTLGSTFLSQSALYSTAVWPMVLSNVAFITSSALMREKESKPQ